jgi:hypothetical protein
LIYINLQRLERHNLGGDAVPVRAYCGHHWRMARGCPVRAITAGETRYRAFSRSIAEL